MLVPAPLPAYTLAPGVGPLDDGQRAALEGCLAALTGRVSPERAIEHIAAETRLLLAGGGP